MKGRSGAFFRGVAAMVLIGDGDDKKDVVIILAKDPAVCARGFALLVGADKPFDPDKLKQAVLIAHDSD